MYGITPSAKIVTRDRLPPVEHVVHSEQRVPRLVGENTHRLRVDAGRRDEIADAIHREHAEREQHSVAEIGDGEQIFQRIQHNGL